MSMGRLSASAALSTEKSTITRFQNLVLPDANAQLITSLNAERTRTASVTLTLPLDYGVWRSQTSATGIAQEVRRAEGDQTLETLRLRMVQSVRLGPVKAEATAFYNGPSLVGGVRFEGIGGLDLALAGDIGGGRFTLSVQDVFDSVDGRHRFEACLDVRELVQGGKAVVVTPGRLMRDKHIGPLGSEGFIVLVPDRAPFSQRELPAIRRPVALAHGRGEPLPGLPARGTRPAGRTPAPAATPGTTVRAVHTVLSGPDASRPGYGVAESSRPERYPAGSDGAGHATRALRLG